MINSKIVSVHSYADYRGPIQTKKKTIKRKCWCILSTPKAIRHSYMCHPCHKLWTKCFPLPLGHRLWYRLNKWGYTYFSKLRDVCSWHLKGISCVLAAVNQTKKKKKRRVVSNTSRVILKIGVIRYSTHGKAENIKLIFLSAICFVQTCIWTYLATYHNTRPGSTTPALIDNAIKEFFQFHSNFHTNSIQYFCMTIILF